MRTYFTSECAHIAEQNETSESARDDFEAGAFEQIVLASLSCLAALWVCVLTASRCAPQREREDGAGRHGQRAAHHGPRGAVDARCSGTATADNVCRAAQTNFYKERKENGES